MRILILVLSYTELPWGGLMQSQWDTWGGTGNNVDVVYYTGKGLIRSVDGRIKGEPANMQFYDDFEIPVSDSYYEMHWKFKKALDHIANKPYDFIFRTNSSSYINKKRLLKHAESLPKEKCFSGWSLGEKEAVSGAGIWLSPDMVKILREEIPPGENIEEDILIGRILHGKYGIEILDDKSRFDVTEENVEYAPLEAMHYRFKTGNRLQDIRNIYRLHKRITK